MSPRAAAVMLVLAACGTTHVHAFDAHFYRVAGDCLEATAVVDVIDGPDLGPCSRVRCWGSPTGDVYVTDHACDAPVDFKDRTTDTTGLCPAAIAAYGRTNHGACAAGTGGTGP